MYIGIDPGKDGGVSMIAKDGSIIRTEKMPDWYQLADLIEWAKYRAGKLCAFVERVGSMPGQGVVSMFRFGEGYGVIQGVLIALRVPYETVTPFSWQRSIHRGVSRKGSLKPKERSLQAIRQMYPDYNWVLPGCRIPHSGIVDATCIAVYGRRITLGKTLEDNVGDNSGGCGKGPKEARPDLKLCDEDG